MESSVAVNCLIVAVVTFGAGLLTLIRQWSDELLHLFVSLGAGIFVGVVFILLLPEALAQQTSSTVPIMVLTGFLLIFFIEHFLLARGGGGYDHGHKVVSLTALVGLSVHSIMDGFAITVAVADPHLGKLLFASVLVHKGPAAFALASLFLLAKLRKRVIVGLLLLFSLMTPLGAAIVAPMATSANGVFLANLTGLTAGSFLYVTTGELLPEVFHTSEKRWLKLGLFLTGLIGVGFLSSMGHEHLVPH
jgi:zinc transporter ZupT